MDNKSEIEKLREEAIRRAEGTGIVVGQIHKRGDEPYSETVGEHTYYFDPLSPVTLQERTRVDAPCYYCGKPARVNGNTSLAPNPTIYILYETKPRPLTFLAAHLDCLVDRVNTKKRPGDA